MARYDDDTKNFIEKVSDGLFALPKNKEKRQDKIEDLTRKGLLITKGLATSPASAARAITSTTIDAALDKLSSMTPLAVFRHLNTNYKRSWWDWEPETIWQTLRKDEGLEANDEIRNVILALQVVVNTNYPFEAWHVFENVGQAFNNNVVSFGVIQPLELHEIALNLKYLDAIRPGQEFDDEVCGYIAASSKNAGVVYLPKDLFLGTCQEKLDDLGNDIELRNEVAATWPNEASETSSLAAQVQLGRLDEIRNYVSNR